jgi:hypothetical protein
MRLTLDFVDRLGQATNISAGNTRNGDASVPGGINGELLGQAVHFFRGHASVGEHANLAGDMGPVVLGAKLLQVLLEEGAHADDAVSHALDLTKPLLVELGVVEDLYGDAGTVDGRVRVHRTDKDLELGVDALLLSGVGTDQGEGTDTLAIQALIAVHQSIDDLSRSHA